MTVIAWIVEGTWRACVDAARTHAPEGAAIVLLHVTGRDVPGAARGAYAGLLGRGHPERDPGTRLQELAAAAARQLLQAAADRLGRPSTELERTGRIKREVVAAAEGADLLILARDGDRAHPGPKSLSPRHPLRHRPRPLPRPAGLAPDPAGHSHHPAPASPTAAPARTVTPKTTCRRRALARDKPDLRATRPAGQAEQHKPATGPTMLSGRAEHPISSLAPAKLRSAKGVPNAAMRAI